MKTFDIIRARIKNRKTVVSVITRPDLSAIDLRKFQNEGFSQVYFEANLQSDPDCEVLNGNIYDISELLTYDNPIYRTSHPNCNCKFKPVPSSRKQQNEQPGRVPATK
jgi:hypothetical protein